jgi:hypothetical protein
MVKAALFYKVLKIVAPANSVAFFKYLVLSVCLLRFKSILALTFNLRARFFLATISLFSISKILCFVLIAENLCLIKTSAINFFTRIFFSLRASASAKL